mmetsp:Transcript_15724/g.28611  ORF Transcript_15724/g.28611 Transcript_15724/m.28611 type:complete len:241 (+) Transcript_15724:1532-2254(+)
MSNHNSLRRASGSRSVHDHSACLRGRRNGWKSLHVSRLYKFFKRENLDTLWRSWEFNLFIGGNHVGCVNNCLERFHRLDAVQQDFDITFVAYNGGDVTIVHCKHHGFDSKGSINCRDTHALREGSESSRHPFRACVFENSQRAWSNNLFQSTVFGRSNHANLAERSTKLMGFHPDLFKGFGLNTSEFLDLGCVLSKIFTGFHAVARCIPLKSILLQIIQRVYSFPGCSDPFCLIVCMNAV